LNILEEIFGDAMDSQSPFFLTTLVIAFYNIAVEYERLRNYDAADEYYRKGYEAA
jgi:hypothetical protein